MVKRSISLLLFFLFLIDPAWTQSQTYPLSRMEQRADSLSRITDSLINSQKLFHIIFENKYPGDTTLYFRHYYIDTLNRYLVKCIFDTTFDDYFNRRFTQVVIYFNQGFEFKNCYYEKSGIISDICNLYNIYPEENEIAPQTGQLNKNWTKDRMDAKMKAFVRDDITIMKFIQKRRNYN
jgi:hypothetical protein